MGTFNFKKMEMVTEISETKKDSNPLLNFSRLIELQFLINLKSKFA